MNIMQAFIGLEIFMHNGAEETIQAEHDIIYGPPRDSMLLSVAEVEVLEKAGWFVDSNTEYWSHFC